VSLELKGKEATIKGDAEAHFRAQPKPSELGGKWGP